MGGHHGTRGSCGGGGAGGSSGGVHVRLFLGLDNVLLVPDPLVAEPVADLTDGDAALPRQLLLGLLTGVRIGKVRVEILIEDLCGFFGKISTFSALIKEPRPEDHDCLTRGLFQLHLDAGELFLDDSNHPVNLLGRDGSGS